MNMTRKTTTPKEITEILALREVGFTVLAISQKCNLSLRTIHRYLAENGVKKGSLKKEVIESARAELSRIITSNPSILETAAQHLIDDIAHSSHLRAIMIEASEYLKANTLAEAVLVMRGAAAYSTAIKNTSDTLRHALGADKIVDETDDLPELIVRELTSEEIKEIMSRPLTIDD
jgi:hypothetical protein